MNRGMFLTTARAAAIFREAVGIRRLYCADHEFFLMTDFCEQLCDDGGAFAIWKYPGDKEVDFDRKAGISSFDGRARMTVDSRLWERAKRGDQLTNFVLAHEVMHSVLDHHNKHHGTKNFELSTNAKGMRVRVPPSVEEQEADYGAVFLQCGVALLNPQWDSVRLASRANTDLLRVKKLQNVVRLDVFHRELARITNKSPRQVF